MTDYEWMDHMERQRRRLALLCILSAVVACVLAAVA